jgi:hypothetical protein
VGHGTRILPAAAVGILVSLSLPVAYASRDLTRLEPGPTTISPEEAAIVADPEAGIEHGVILVKEFSRNEARQAGTLSAFHLRAKILSNEGRDLANVELPLFPGVRLVKWWGRTLLPDGSVLELPRSELERTLLVRTGKSKLEAVKAALPGVVPGSVIDYGWIVSGEAWSRYERVRIQGSFPVHRFSYYWKPSRYVRGAYRLYETEELDVQVTVEDDSIIIEGRDIPSIVDEPLMPPDHDVRASAVLYLMPLRVDFEDYWDTVATSVASRVDASRGKKKHRTSIMEAIAFPADGTAEQKMRTAYEWIESGFKRTDVKTFEEIEEARDDESSLGNLLTRLLESGEGSPFELQILLIVVAQELGAEGHLLLVADRTSGSFDPALRSTRQVDATLAAISFTGGNDVWILDPGTGLVFGDFPWWFSGGLAMLATEDGAKYVKLPVTSSVNNLSRRAVELRFLDDNEVVGAEWTEAKTGQASLHPRRKLRRLAPEEREKRLENMCGADSDVDVVEAEVEGLEDFGDDLLLRCDVELLQTDLEQIDRYEFRWDGPWLGRLPDLSAETRTHPLIFDYPRTETVTISVRPPDLFEAGSPPSGAEFETAYGRYALDIRRDDDGYTIDRELELFRLSVPADEYDALREFFQRVEQADRTIVEFRRSEAP